MTDDIPVAKGSAHHKALSALAAKGALTTQELRATLFPSWSVSKTRDSMFEMVRTGLVGQIGFDGWTINNAGLNAVVMLGRHMEQRAKEYRKSSGLRDVYGRANYEPLELGLTCHRPGAYDAFHLPSRINNKLHYRSGLVVDFAEQQEKQNEQQS
jgi:hypothetical protein